MSLICYMNKTKIHKNLLKTMINILSISIGLPQQLKIKNYRTSNSKHNPSDHERKYQICTLTYKTQTVVGANRRRWTIFHDAHGDQHTHWDGMGIKQDNNNKKKTGTHKILSQLAVGNCIGCFAFGHRSASISEWNAKCTDGCLQMAWSFCVFWSHEVP